MALKPIYATLWDVCTTATGVRNLEVTVTTLKNKVTKATAAMKALAAQNNSAETPLFLFVAPEYLMQRSSTQRFFEEDVYTRVVQELGAFSASCAETLFVPGTLCWRELKRELRTTGAGFYGSLGKGQVKEIEKKRSTAAKIYDGRNTALLFYGARGPAPLMQYNKRYDAGECLSGDDKTDFPGGTGVPLFQMNGLSFAVEICADHCRSALGNQIGNVPQIHLQIVISNGMTHSFATGEMGRIPVMDGGYLIHQDGSVDRAQGSGVWQVARGHGTHGTATSTRVEVAPDQYATEKAKYTALGFLTFAGGKSADGSKKVFDWADKYAIRPTPNGATSNAIKLDPIDNATDDAELKVYYLPVNVA